MFAKDKVTQSMLDAVNKVLGEDKKLLLEPGKSEKVATPTGTKVYGHRYGNSAKARKDQTAHEIDKIKGPKDKEMKEAAKPDFLDMDKDGNKKESMKKAIADKNSMKEELKGNQEKIDANHNDKIDAQDFKILRGKKKVKEGMEFANKLLSSIHEKKDVVMPEASATPAKNTDVADKSYLKDMGKKPTVKSDLKNLGRFLTGKKETNEEVELHEDNLDSIAKKHGMELNRTTYGAGMKHPTKGEISINRYGEWNHKGSKASGDSTDKFSSLDKHLSSMKEETSLSEKLDPKSKTLDTLLGRKKVPASYDNEHTSPKVKLEAEESVQEGAFKQMDIDRQDRESALEKDGWKKMPANVTDKSGAKHTPMSRAKDLARSAFKKLKTETLMGKAGTTSESKKKW
jgi:hypothetical protein